MCILLDFTSPVTRCLLSTNSVNTQCEREDTGFMGVSLRAGGQIGKQAGKRAGMQAAEVDVRRGCDGAHEGRRLRKGGRWTGRKGARGRGTGRKGDGEGGGRR